MRLTNPKTQLVITIVLLAMAGTVAGQIICVDADANGADDGTSWTDAFNYLQDGLGAASSGDEILVAEGIYRPDCNSANPDGTGDQEATFRLVDGVALKGGYAGFGEPDPNVRDIDEYETILSGDLNGNDVGDPYDPSRDDNCYHVVTGGGTDGTAVLDGFTITAGNADGSYPHYRGGGMFNEDGDPVVSNCTFRSNSARYGGGIDNDRCSRPAFVNCEFIGNVAEHGGGMYGTALHLKNCTFVGNSAHKGGGMETEGSCSNMTLTNCSFVGNSAATLGGGLLNFDTSSMILVDCWFSENSAEQGAGMCNDEADPVLINCAFLGNSASDTGGGMANVHGASPIMVNCLFGGNSAGYGGAAYSSGGRLRFNNCTFSGNRADQDCGGIFGRRTEITSCILWKNADKDGEDEAAQIYTQETLLVNYCCIQGWTGDLGGIDNIGADPCFAGPGYWADANDPNIAIEPNDPNAVWIDGDYHLLPDSPCIDAGDPNYVAGPNETDLDGYPRVLDGDRDGNSVVDMGSYEMVPEPKVFYVDDDAPNDPGPGDPNVSDANEDGSPEHPFDVIQEAIDETIRDDTIIVQPGLYPGHVNFLGKDITLRSTNPSDLSVVSETVIGEDSLEGEVVVIFRGIESPSCILAGFDINGAVMGYDVLYGNQHTRATIAHCVLQGNRGGGVIYGCDGLISNCLVVGNADHTATTVLKPTIGGCCGVISNCTIADNRCGYAIHVSSPSLDPVCSLTIENCIVYGNQFPQVSVAYATVDILFSDIQGGRQAVELLEGTLNWGPGNADADPCFAMVGDWDANGTPADIRDDFWVDGNYRLLADSPCIDAGDPNYTVEPNETDLDGNPRIADGDNDGNSVVDMGAFEYFVPPVECRMRFTPKVLNLLSKGKWVKAHLVLPEGFGAGDVDTNSPIRIIEPFELECEYMNVFINEDGLVEIEGAFSRGQFCEAVISNEGIELMVVGWFTSGQQFYGADTIKITNNALKYLGALASYWLEAGCGEPDWCGELDVDQDGSVDFEDFALLDGHCVEIGTD